MLPKRTKQRMRSERDRYERLCARQDEAPIRCDECNRPAPPTMRVETEEGFLCHTCDLVQIDA